MKRIIFLTLIGSNILNNSSAYSQSTFDLNERIILYKMNMDTTSYHSIYTWYIRTHVIKSKKQLKSGLQIKYYDIPVFIIDEKCFRELDCNFRSENFANCIVSTNKPALQSIFSINNEPWQLLDFAAGSFRVYTTHIFNISNFYQQRYDSFYELIEHFSDSNIFDLMGNFCKFKDGRVMAYMGDGRFIEFADHFDGDRGKVYRSIMGCR